MQLTIDTNEIIDNVKQEIAEQLKDQIRDELRYLVEKEVKNWERYATFELSRATDGSLILTYKENK